MSVPRPLVVPLVCGFLFAAISSTPAHASLAKPHFTVPSFYTTQTTFGFAQPIGMAVAPDGRMFITDNAGIVWTSKGGGAKAKPLFDLSDHVNETQDRGLVSVAVDKEYSLNRKIYLAYTFEDRSKAELESNSSLANLPKTQRLVWLKVPSELELEGLTEPIKIEPGEEHVVLGSYSSDPEHPGVPFSTEHACPQPSDLVKGDWSTANKSDCIPDDSIEHTIDSVRVDPNDGTLWVSVGDGSDGGAALDPDSWRSQRVESYSGKLLHISTTGEGLPGHPFCPSDENLKDVCTKVYAKGFRNPFRFFFRPSPDGRPTVSDAGWSTREELDLAEKGKNYGWPCREGKIPTPTWSEEGQCKELVKEMSEKGESFTEPVYDYHPEAGGAIVGGITYTGSGGANDYPAEFEGAIFITDFVTSKLSYLRLNKAGTEVEPGYPKVLSEEFMAVDWAPAANGDLMFVDIGFGEGNFAQIRQISFDAANAPPEAAASASKTYGALPLHVKFNASESSDPNGEKLSYAWDFNEDGKTDSTAKEPEWTFEESVNTNVKLTVEDGKGGEDSKAMEIYAGDEHEPEPSFDSGPTTYTDGEEITIAGSAKDEDEGSLGVGSLFWNVRLNHAGTHVHPITEKSGVGSVTFPTDIAHDSPSSYEVELTATDGRGLKKTILRKLTPVTKLVRIDSSPEGAPISYGGVNETTPFEKQSTIGLHTTVSAAASFSQGGSEYEFESWSDGGERIHDLEIPSEDISLNANYRKVSGPEEPPPPTGDTTPASLVFNPKHGLKNKSKAVLRGTASDASGLRKVQVALRQAHKVGKRCRWWAQGKGGFPRGTRSCGHPVYMRAKLKGSGEKVTWVLPLGGHLPRGRYLLLFRTVDGAGNVGFGPGGKHQVPLRAK
ncbi:MAG: PQQ-dependent sugar dehydrogenase [Chloroflexota bacterium]